MLKKLAFTCLLLTSLASYANDFLDIEKTSETINIQMASSEQQFKSLGIKASDVKTYSDKAVDIMKSNMEKYSIKGNFELLVTIEAYKSNPPENCKKDYKKCVMQRLQFSFNGTNDPILLELIKKEFLALSEIRITNFNSQEKASFIVSVSNTSNDSGKYESI